MKFHLLGGLCFNNLPKVIFTRLNKVCKLVLSDINWRERTLLKRLSNMRKNCFLFSVFFFFSFLFFFFLQRFNTPILFHKTRLKTLLFRVKATLEIKKRHGNSRENFATEEETFFDSREILIFYVSGKFDIELILRCLFLQTVAKLSITCNVSFCDLVQLAEY